MRIIIKCVIERGRQRTQTSFTCHTSVRKGLKSCGATSFEKVLSRFQHRRLACARMKSLLIIVALLACSVQSKQFFSRGSTSFKKVFSTKGELPKSSFSEFVAKTAAGPWQAALRTVGITLQNLLVALPVA